MGRLGKKISPFRSARWVGLVWSCLFLGGFLFRGKERKGRQRGGKDFLSDDAESIASGSVEKGEVRVEGSEPLRWVGCIIGLSV